MKRLFSLVFALTIFAACQKTTYVAPPASVTVVHAMPVGSPIVPLFGTKQQLQYFSTMQTIRYGGSFLFSPVPGQSSTSVQIVPKTDTVFNIFKGNISFTSGSIYTLFLSGDTAHVDTVLSVDNIPYHADSSTGVRFINLVSSSSHQTQTLSVNLVGNYPSPLEFSLLGYKQLTGFKSYAAKSSSPSNYKFEIRDATSGTLYSTYTWNYSPFHNQTIVVAGASTASLKIFTVNNY